MASEARQRPAAAKAAAPDAPSQAAASGAQPQPPRAAARPRPPPATEPPPRPQNSLLYDIVVATVQVVSVTALLLLLTGYAALNLPHEPAALLWPNNSAPAPPGTPMGRAWFAQGRTSAGGT